MIVYTFSIKIISINLHLKTRDFPPEHQVKSKFMQISSKSNNLNWVTKVRS